MGDESRDDHLTDQVVELAASYVLGACGEHEARAFSRLVERHAGLAAEVKELAEVVALLGLSAPPIEPPADLRRRLFDSLEPKTGRAGGGSGKGTSGFFTIRADEGEWENLGEGIRIKNLFVNPSRGTQTFLLRIAAGSRMPGHRHTAIEELFVIEGDCRINGEVLEPGDYRCALAGSSDRLLMTETGTTVLIVGPIHYEAL